MDKDWKVNFLLNITAQLYEGLESIKQKQQQKSKKRSNVALNSVFFVSFRAAPYPPLIILFLNNLIISLKFNIPSQSLNPPIECSSHIASNLLAMTHFNWQQEKFNKIGMITFFKM